MDNTSRSRREFVTRAAAVTAASLGAAAAPAAAAALNVLGETTSPADWDLGWVQKVAGASDRALFDWPTLGNPADPSTLWFADRYLQNCDSVYGVGAYRAALVFNVRTQAVPAALRDELWAQYTLGAEYKVNDPHTSQPALRNPFWHAAPDMMPGLATPSLGQFASKGAMILVCDFALGHLATRLATASRRPADEIHAELLRGLVPGAYAVPSGVFGLAKAQNAGCALVRMT